MRAILYYIPSLIFRKKIFFLGRWTDHPYWRPAQCFMSFMQGGVVKQIYIRWSHHDPWRAFVIDQGIWTELDIPFYTSEDDLGKIKEFAVFVLKNGMRRFKV
jgi:hypothetical protein